jgi:uncharacterized protein VirK/YbjX
VTPGRLRELQRASGLRWSRPGDWPSLLRGVRVLRHRRELGALLELDIVKRSLREARGPAALSFLFSRQFIARTLGLEQRLGCALYHYRYEQASFRDSYVESVYSAGGLTLWRHPAADHVFEIRLMLGNDNLCEGFLSAVAFIDGQRVCVMSFCYVDAALFGWPAGPTLFVTRKQSGRHPEHLHFFAQSFKHTSPPYFCFAAIAGIARALGADEIAAIRSGAHPHYERDQAEVMQNSYDEFWKSLGACAQGETAYRLVLSHESGDPTQLSAAHRRRARKRREDRLAVEKSAAAAIREQLAERRESTG